MALDEAGLRASFLRGLEGEADEYRSFLDQLGGLLRGYFRRRMVNFVDEVEDLVQECLLAVHVQRHTYDPAQPLTPWVYAVARYKFVDCLRRRGRSPELAEPLDEESELFAFEDREAADACRDLGVLLETLPDRQRLPIVYVKLEGLSVAETARKTGMSESAVKVGVHRGLKALAARIRGGP